MLVAPPVWLRSFLTRGYVALRSDLSNPTYTEETSTFEDERDRCDDTSVTHA